MATIDDHVALVGRDFALLARAKDDHIRRPGDDFVAIPLAQISARWAAE